MTNLSRYDIDIQISGLDEFRREFERLPDIALNAASMALGTSAKSIRKMSADEINRQINFGPSYLAGDDNEKLKIVRYSNTELRADIVARKRPTSLARFATDKKVGRRSENNPVRIKVKGRVKTGVAVQGGGRKRAPAFLVNLRKGGEDSGNVGLAIRLKKGESLRDRRMTLKTFGRNKDLALLYGPSVDQIFGSVRVDLVNSGIVGSTLAKEFDRQFRRLSRG